MKLSNWLFVGILSVQLLAPLAFSQPRSPEDLAGLRYREQCAVATTNEEYIFQDELKWNLPFTEMGKLFNSLYFSGKRMLNRVFWSERQNEFLMPIEMPNPRDGIQPARVSLQFIASVKTHLEMALEKGYADFGYFGDMGHNHFLIPMDAWEQEYANLNFDRRDELYTKILADPRLKMLYHTAEQLKMQDEQKNLLPDPYIQFRYQNRNIVGDNKGSSELEVHVNKSGGFNTVGSVPGYYWWSSGIYLHSSQNGCFEYQVQESGKTQTLRFDLSNSSTPLRPGSGTGDEFN